MTPDVRVEVTHYVVSVVPESYTEWLTWSVTVERRAPDQWAVSRHPMVFSRTGAKATPPVPAFEPSPSGRSDHFKQVYRFGLDEALELARQIAPKMVINGMTGPQYMAWYDDRHKRKGQDAHA